MFTSIVNQIWYNINSLAPLTHHHTSEDHHWAGHTLLCWWVQDGVSPSKSKSVLLRMLLRAVISTLLLLFHPGDCQQRTDDHWWSQGFSSWSQPQQETVSEPKFKNHRSNEHSQNRERINPRARYYSQDFYDDYTEYYGKISIIYICFQECLKY